MITIKFSCSDCDRSYDACLDPGAIGVSGCACAVVPVCGKRTGVTALLTEAKAFSAARDAGQAAARGDYSFLLGAGEPDGTRVVCVHARTGGAGVSCAAIGMGRELARYRDVRACYLCLTDLESAALLPDSCAAAMPAEALLYRCLRLAGRDAIRSDATDYDGLQIPETLKILMQAAWLPDEYGLLRLGADANLNALSGLTPLELWGLLALIERSLGSIIFVLDFGTRARLLQAVCEIGEVKTFEVERERKTEERACAEGVWQMPACPEDIQRSGERIDVALANAFGLRIKEMCDSLFEV